MGDNLEKPHIEIEDVGAYYVTRRSFELMCERMSGLRERILELPPNSIALEVGSDHYQSFSVGVKKIRPDIRTLSIDPTIGFGRNRTDIKTERKSSDNVEFDDSIAYMFYGSSLSKEEIQTYKEIQDQRIETKEEGTVAALAPDLPIAEKSIDLLVDHMGPIVHIATDYLLDYVKSIVKVLKPGGEAWLASGDQFQRKINMMSGEDAMNITRVTIEDFIGGIDPDIAISIIPGEKYTTVVLKKPK